jgi:hypothetical protein
MRPPGHTVGPSAVHASMRPDHMQGQVYGGHGVGRQGLHGHAGASRGSPAPQRRVGLRGCAMRAWPVGWRRMCIVCIRTCRTVGQLPNAPTLHHYSAIYRIWPATHLVTHSARPGPACKFANMLILI